MLARGAAPFAPPLAERALRIGVDQDSGALAYPTGLDGEVRGDRRLARAPFLTCYDDDIRLRKSSGTLVGRPTVGPVPDHQSLNLLDGQCLAFVLDQLLAGGRGRVPFEPSDHCMSPELMAKQPGTLVNDS